jgi:hypothetical protein
MAKMLFQDFDIPALYIANTSALALFASSKVTGVVVDCGTFILYCHPFWCCYFSSSLCCFSVFLLLLKPQLHGIASVL